LEVCQRLGRRFLAAEINPKYHAMILSRLQTGQIRDEYRLIKRTVRREALAAAARAAARVGRRGV
jgi:hypothetical protein